MYNKEMYQLYFFEELKNINYNGNEIRNILSAIFRQSGSIIKSNKKIKLELSFDGYEKAFMVAGLIERHYGFKSEIKTSTGDTINKEKQYIINIPLNETKRVLEDLDILIFKDDEVKEMIRGIPRFCESAEDFSAFLTGIMISSGYVFIPEILSNELNNGFTKNSGYRIEIYPINEELSKDIIKKLKDYSIEIKATVRKESGVLYSSDSNTVSDLLALIKAHTSVTRLQNLIIERSIKNNSNRQRNCNIANIDKSIAAAEKIIEAIDLLKDKKIYNTLNDKLREAGDLRYDNMDLSLEELAEKAKLTKSCINHRLRKIIEIAEQCK